MSSTLGLGLVFNPKSWSTPPSSSFINVRTLMVLLGATMVLCGSSQPLFDRGRVVCRGLNWKGVIVAIVRAAECSRWFYTVVQATREISKRWPS